MKTVKNLKKFMTPCDHIATVNITKLRGKSEDDLLIPFFLTVK
jgi:hypothetical protein